MALPEGAKLRKGDVVALHGTVMYDPGEDGFISLDVPGATTCIVRPYEIAEIVGRRFNVGDTVKLINRSSPLAGIRMTIEAVASNSAFVWLRMPSGTYHTASPVEIELVEPEDEGAAQ